MCKVCVSIRRALRGGSRCSLHTRVPRDITVTKLIMVVNPIPPPPPHPRPSPEAILSICPRAKRGCREVISCDWRGD